jgi:hypothetical protein
MHVIQNGLVLTLPDDAPLPPDSTQVTLPEELAGRPEAFAVKGDRIVRRPKREIASIARPAKAEGLTQEEIAVLKKAIADGRLDGGPQP